MPPSLQRLRNLTLSFHGRHLRALSYSSIAVSTETDAAAISLSEELLKNPESEPLSIAERLNLSFSHVSPTPSLISSTLKLCPEAGRTVLALNDWLLSAPGFAHNDHTVSILVSYLGRRKDFKAVHEVMIQNRSVLGPKTLNSAVSRLVLAGRPGQAVAFFEKMEIDYGLEKNRASMKLVVGKLCDGGFPRHAEKMVKSLAEVIFPDEQICVVLIRGWCAIGELDEARRLAGEMRRGGFGIRTPAFNAMLDCVCKLCITKEPFRLDREVESALLEMDRRGVPRNTETFRVLIKNLCKLRRTEEALSLFRRMGDWNCKPDAKIHLILIRSLYQAARLGEGDEMISLMRDSGHGEALTKEAYFGFLTILCGVERVDHALVVLEKMKRDKGAEPSVRIYELLIGKLCGLGRAKKADLLFSEARKRGLELEEKAYPLDPRVVKLRRETREAKEAEKMKKRETLPEKTARKKLRLRRIRLSFVKKPKKGMRRSY